MYTIGLRNYTSMNTHQRNLFYLFTRRHIKKVCYNKIGRKGEKKKQVTTICPKTGREGRNTISILQDEIVYSCKKTKMLLQIPTWNNHITMRLSKNKKIKYKIRLNEKKSHRIPYSIIPFILSSKAYKIKQHIN